MPWRRLDPAQVRVSWDQACSFSKRILPKPGDGDALAAHLAAATGERLRRYTDLHTRYGQQRAESAAWASRALPAAVLQRNTIRATPDVFREQLSDASAGAALFAGEAAYLPPAVAFVDTAVFRDGLAYVQDTTAHEAAEAVAAQPGERVLDLCAAPGGKSVALALAMEDARASCWRAIPRRAGSTAWKRTPCGSV